MTSGHDPEWIRKYAEHYSVVNPYPAISSQFSKGSSFDLNSLVSESDLRRTEFFEDFMRPQGILSGGSGLLLDSNGDTTFIIGTLHPHSLREVLDDAAVNVWRKLSSDLVSAWHISKFIGGCLYEESGSNLIDKCSQIVYVTDHTGRAVYLNSAAERALREGTWIIEDHLGRLRIKDHNVDHAASTIIKSLGKKGKTAMAPLSLNIKEGKEAALCTSLLSIQML